MFLTVALTVALSLLTLLAAAPSCESLEEQHRCRNAEIIEPDEVVLLQIELTVNNSPSQQVTNNSDNANATMREDELSNAEKEDLEMFKRTKGSKAFSALDHFILEKLQNDSALRSMVVHGQLVKKDVKSRVTHALAHVLVGNRTSETEEITEVLDDQLDAMHQWWTHLSAARRYKKVAERTLFEMFLAHSAGSLDWLMLIPAIVLFMSEWYSKATDHSTPPADVTRLLLWWIVAGIYFVLVFVRAGKHDGVMWLDGYILEFVFGFENMLIFHAIASPFKLHRRVQEKAVFIVILLQNVFQAVFYMGLAGRLRQCHPLPYLLGVWLIYVGTQAAYSEHTDTSELEDFRLFHFVKTLLGERLWLEQSSDDDMLVLKAKKCRISRAGLMLVLLLVADFLLEIDVTLTKIETSYAGDKAMVGYICFSSSMTASFAAPALFFVCDGLFRRFSGLKYGIALVLVWIGMQMLMNRVFTVPAMLNIAILLVMMCISAFVWELLSKCADWHEVRHKDVTGSHDNTETTKTFSSIGDKPSYQPELNNEPGGPDQGAG